MILSRIALFAAFATVVFAQVPTPESVLGYKPGSDFRLTTYDESLGYFQKLDAASDSVKLVNVGKTTQGRDWYLALISSPQNLAQLDKYKEIARKLALVKGLTDEQARQLSREGKAIVHIDGGLHSTEVAGQEHTMQLAYNLVSRSNDPEVSRILNEVIFVLWFSLNPDGQNMVAKWYRQNLGTPYEVSPMPWLYQEYVGHDNNRDGYMNNMIESRVINKVMQEYWPQVMYNHHQVAPFPSRIWIPPFAEPISTQVHPLMWRWVNVFGTSMAAYLDQHGMPGSMHRGRFDDWYPGFIDHVNSFRNTVSFLTETALYRYATPRYYTIDEFPKEKQDLRPEVFYSSPWKGGWWRLKDAVDYMIGASMSVLVTASKNREELLYNRYQAGRDTVERYTKEPPFAYVIPREQRDLPTAALLVEKMMLAGLEVMETTDPVRFNGMDYKPGSWVISMDQPFARLAHELFEVQKYPELPEGPYDVTGWTLPMQMGVETAAVTVPLEAQMKAKMRKLTGTAPQLGNVPPAVTQNARFKAINEAFAAGAKPDAKLNPPSRAPKIGVYRPWAASMDEGWTRWVMEQFKFPYTNLYNADVQAGHLKDRFDVIVFADIPSRTILEGHQPGTIEGRYAGGIGANGVEALREFANAGGTLVMMNNSSQFAITQFQLPVTNVLAGLRPAEFNCPGALLRVEIQDPNHPLVAGAAKEAAVMFERGPAFETKSGFKGKILASYPKETNPLLSGYVAHPEKIQGKAAMVDVQMGAGHVVLIGFRSQWRGQPHGTFKFLFNSLYYFANGGTVAGSSAAAAGSTAAAAVAGGAVDAEWRRLTAQVRADAEKLAAANRAFFGAKGAKAVEESKKLEAAVTAFLKDRVSSIDGYKDQSEDRAVARKVSEYGQAARKMANDASSKDWTESKDVMAVYRLDALEQEITALLGKKQ